MFFSAFLYNSHQTVDDYKEDTLKHQPNGHNKIPLIHHLVLLHTQIYFVIGLETSTKLRLKRNATYLSQACTMCTLRLHINQVLVEVPKLLHGGPEGHNLAGGVCRAVHLCSRHPAASPDVTWKKTD